MPIRTGQRIERELTFLGRGKIMETMTPSPTDDGSAASFLDGGGECGGILRAIDWTKHPLGAPARWPLPLRLVVRLMLNTQHPMFIFWGDKLFCFYNDAYRRSIGADRHPSIMGRPGQEAWAEVWPVIGPQIEKVMIGRGATWHENALVPITRDGFLEEVWWSYGYSPIDDPDAPNGVGGILVLCTETTEVMKQTRRQAVLLELETLLRTSPSARAAMNVACALLGSALNIPLVGLRELDDDGEYSIVSSAWSAPGAVSETGGYRIADLGPTRLAHVRRGETLLIEDAINHPMMADPGVRESFTTLGIRALIDVPLMRDGKVTAILFGAAAEPRRWTDDETRLMRQALNRIWDAIERLRAEDRLAVAKAAARLGIYEYHMASGTIIWDDRVRELWGAAPDEPITYRTFLNGLHPDDRTFVESAVREASDPTSDGRFEVEYRVIRRGDGVKRWIAATGLVAFENSEPVRMIGTVRDVTDRKEAAQALAESEQRLAMALAGTSDGIWDWDVLTGAVTVSPRMVEMLGYSPAEWEQTYSTWAQHVHPDDLDGVEEVIRQHLDGETPTYAAKFRMRCKDARWVWILSRGRAQRDAAGVAIRMVGTHIDVTAQHEAERRDAFRADLADRLAKAETAEEVMASAAATLGPYLGVAACGYAEADATGEMVTVRNDWTAPGMPSYADASYRMEDYGAALAALLRAGKPVIVSDTQTDPLTVANAAAHAAIHSLAFLNVPLLRRGVPVGLLYCTADRPRAWTLAEVALVAEVAGRTRSALDRARAEANLRDSEARLRLATEGAGVGTWELNLKTGLGEWSPEGVALFGMDRSHFTAEDWAEAVHASDRVLAAAAWQSTVEGDAPYEIEYRAAAAAPNGSERWLLARGRVERDASGAPVRGAGVLLDITARKRAENDLRLKTQELESLMANAPLGIAFFDRNHRYIRINAELATINGITMDDHLGRSIEELLPENSRVVAPIIDGVFLTGETVRNLEVTGETPRAPRVKRSWLTSYYAVHGADDQIVAVGAWVVDISDRKTAEEQLKASEARMRAIVDGAPIGLVFADAPSGRITGGNARVEEIVGHPVLPSPNTASYGEWVSFHPDGRQVEGHEYPLARVVSGESDRSELEVLYRRGDGREAWIKFVATPIKNDAGEVTGGVVASLDVDEQRRAESGLRRLNDSLAQEVAEAVAKRETALTQLHEAQKMETIGQLTGGVAHDFNNLLSAILSNLDLVRKHVDDTRIAKLVDGAIKGAERGAALTKRLLAFARRQELKAEAVDLATLLAGMQDLLVRSLGPGVRIAYDTPPGLPPVSVDLNQLELALLNLAVNARDAMPMGGALTIEASAESVAAGEVEDLASGEYVRLCVSDTGQGMDAETLKRATEPFFTTKSIDKGTGLGLSMVQGLVAQSGGAMRIRSVLGRGTTIEIWLRRAEATMLDQPRSIAATGAVETTVKPLAILVVDDDFLVSMGTVAMLEDLGHTVLEASSGRKALEVIELTPAIDLVITDHAMPGMTGIQLAGEIRQRRPGLPIVLASGYADLPNGEDPGLPRLSKPFRQEDLAHIIEGLLGEMAEGSKVVPFRR